MATIEAYETKAGKRYRVRYRKPDRGTSMKRGFTTKRDAELWKSRNVVEQSRGEFVEVSASKVTVSELGAVWVQNQTQLKASSLRPVESAWRVHVEPRWGKTPIANIKHTDVKSWVAQLTESKSPTVVIRCYGILAKILDEAVKDRRLSSNPIRGLDNLPRKVGKEHIYLTHQQVDDLAHEAKHGTLVRVLAYTGLRWGEVTALRVRDVNPMRRRLTVVLNAVEVGSAIVVGTPKTHKKRTVPFPEFLSEPLMHQMAGKHPDDLLFPGEDGKHMKRSGTSKTSNGWFVNALRRAGLQRMTIHDLRHTAASLAISEGANVKSVQAMLGHASATMTLDTYADLFPDDLDAVAVALNNAVALKVRSRD